MAAANVTNALILNIDSAFGGRNDLCQNTTNALNIGIHNLSKCKPRNNAYIVECWVP